MKEKYYGAVEFFSHSDKEEDQKQLVIAVKEYQRFSKFYEKMNKYLIFDPDEIEEEVYSRLDEDSKVALANPLVVAEIHQYRIKKAGKILEDEDVNTMNF